jgi:acetylornithine deacetylase/succinyl-diaminopimelate desuccinylase-like protein
LFLLPKAINVNRVKIKGDFSSKPSAITDMHPAAYKKAEAAVNKVSGKVTTTPYIISGAIVSRYYRKVCNSVVNFSPVTDGSGFHSINERLPIIDYKRCISFFNILMQD